jgi:hypothetical protein
MRSVPTLDPTYFSRGYKKLSGVPPQRDITWLRSNLELGGIPAVVRVQRK